MFRNETLTFDKPKTIYLKDELILTHDQTQQCFDNIKKENNNMKFPSPKEYLEAKKTAKAYEKRQRQLKALEEELSDKLSEFAYFKFRINKKKGEVIFAGLHDKDYKMKIGTAKKSTLDVHEPVIGKLIAVKKALGENIDDVVKLVEKEEMTTTIYHGGSTITFPKILDSRWHIG